MWKLFDAGCKSEALAYFKPFRNFCVASCLWSFLCQRAVLQRWRGLKLSVNILLKYLSRRELQEAPSNLITVFFFCAPLVPVLIWIMNRSLGEWSSNHHSSVYFKPNVLRRERGCCSGLVDLFLCVCKAPHKCIIMLSLFLFCCCFFLLRTTSVLKKEMSVKTEKMAKPLKNCAKEEKIFSSERWFLIICSGLRPRNQKMKF